jgi:mannosyltransferase
VGGRIGGARVTTVLLDDIIYRLQAFGGASDFWRSLSTELHHDQRLQISHVPGSRFGRILPVRTSARVLHSSHFRVPLGRDTRCVTTIHDLTYELGFAGGRSAPLNKWQRRQAVTRADTIVCTSEYTRQGVLDFYSDEIRTDVPISVIPHGRTYEGPSGAALPERFDLDSGRYLLHVGNRAGYKNFPTALNAFAASALPANGIQMVCTGSPFSADESSQIARHRLDAQVLAVGTVSTSELGVGFEHPPGGL